jgi:hypothetical protein
MQLFLCRCLELSKPDELRSPAPAIETRDAKRGGANTKVCWISHTITRYPALTIRTRTKDLQWVVEAGLHKALAGMSGYNEYSKVQSPNTRCASFRSTG